MLSRQTPLFSKDGFTCSKQDTNHYLLSFCVENHNLDLSEFLNFGLIQLVYDLNKDIYQCCHLERTSDNQVMLSALMVHLFEDLGLPQKYTHMNVTRTAQQNTVTFVAQSIYQDTPPPAFVPKSAEQLLLRQFVCVCNCENPHVVQIECTLVFEERMKVPAFAEKMVGTLFYKVFSRVKQFLEQMRV